MREDFAPKLPELPDAEFAYYTDLALAHRYDPAQTLVISGFWRSGTTWLEEALREILNAKTLFEPLCPLAIDCQQVHGHCGVNDRSFEFLRLFLPFCQSPTLDGHPLKTLFARALTGRAAGAWIRRFRKTLDESLRPRLVVKFVRAQLCLRAARNTFRMPVLHIHRDPRAVIASVRKTRWHWLFDHLNLQEQLLDIQDGRAGYFGQWRDAIQEYDRGTPVERIAAYWCLTEKFVQENFADNPQRFFCVSYERLVQERETIFARVLAALGLRPWQEEFSVLYRDSTTTSKRQRGASVKKRVGGWRKSLSLREATQIERVVERFGLADRLVGRPVVQDA